MKELLFPRGGFFPRQRRVRQRDIAKLHKVIKNSFRFQLSLTIWTLIDRFGWRLGNVSCNNAIDWNDSVHRRSA